MGMSPLSLSDEIMETGGTAFPVFIAKTSPKIIEYHFFLKTESRQKLPHSLHSHN